jgi:hypothetical protein
VRFEVADVEHLVAAFVAIEVLGCHVALLEHRPRGTIGDNDAFGKGAPQGDGTLSSFLNHEPGRRITECRA